MGRKKKSIISWLLVLALLLTGIGWHGSGRYVSADTGDGLAADAKVDAGKVSVTVTKTISGNWLEFMNWEITNHMSEAIKGVQVVLPISPKPSTFKAWNISVSYNEEIKGAVVYYSGTIAAGSTVTIGDGENYKLGFTMDGVTVGEPYVRGFNCKNSSGGVLPENTDYYPEHPEDNTGNGGSSSSGGSTTAENLNYELTGETKEVAPADTPYGKHGKLHLKQVDGYGNAPVIVDEHDQPFQLRGASTHGLQWFPAYVNEGSFQSLRDEWGVNMIRLAAYAREGGYIGNEQSIDALIQKGVEAATKLGLYVMVDWHVLSYNPNETKTEAEAFFRKYAAMYKDYGNVIFEVCNEPKDTNWYNNGAGNDLYTYCKDMVQIIRTECGSDALIACGTNTWSQDVDQVAGKPLSQDGYEDILYSLHYYAGEAAHKEGLRAKAQKAIDAGTPLFVTEFGITAASGDGACDGASADVWMEFLDKHNISCACWSFSNDYRSSSYLKNSCSKTSGGWLASDLTATGIWLVNTYRAHQDKENNTDTTVTAAPKDSNAPSASPGEDGKNTAAPAGSMAPGIKPSDDPNAPIGEDGKSTAAPKASDDPNAPIDEDGKSTAAPKASDDPNAPVGEDGKNTATPAGSATPGVKTSDAPISSYIIYEGTTPAPTGQNCGGTGSTQTSSAPSASVAPGGSSGTTPSGTSPSVTAAPSGSVTTSGGDGSTETVSSIKVKVTLKKKVIKLKKGKKARIVIKKKASGDKVRKYKVIGKKGIVKVTKKGVIKAKKKGRVKVQVIMKSNAKAACRVIVK